MEKVIETIMYRSRWLLAPIYLGLSVALIALGVKFFQEAVHVVLHAWQMKETELILVVLSLIDIAMVGGLLVMVMMSGYENFVSEINLSGDEEKLSWLGKMDSSSLKAKIAASIVAISSIHLLKVFMNIKDIESEKLTWYVVIHLTFVASAFAMGSLDRITRQAKPAPVAVTES